MIESDCAGCTDFQDVQPPTRDYPQQQQYSATIQSRHSQAASNHQVHRDSPSSAFTTPPPPPTTSPVTPVNLQQGLNYFQHNQFQPLVGQHLLLASPTLGPEHLPFGLNGRFALTPDARACVTATYLCVLIVNNTWLDCNLLETLCNNSTNHNNESDKELSSSATEEEEKRQEEYQKLAAAAEATMRLNALESALSELIAMTGGGSDSDSAQDHGDRSFGESLTTPSDGVYRAKSVFFKPEEARASLQRLVEPYVDKGGGKMADHLDLGGGEGSDGAMMRYRSSRLPERDQQLQDTTKHSHGIYDPGGESEEKMAEHYLSLPQETPEHQTRQQLPSFDLTTPPAEATNRSQFDQTTVSSQTPSSSSLLASWVGRPFRGWGSYSFWPSGGTGNHQPPGRLDDIQKPADPQKNKQLVQILKLVDRTEQYNDIVTNQSSMKQQTLRGIPQAQQQQIQHQHQRFQQLIDQQQQHQPEKSGIQVSNTMDNDSSATHGRSSANANDNKSDDGPIFAFSPAPATVQGPPFGSIGEHLGSHPDHIDSSKSSAQYPLQRLPPTTTPATAMLGIYEFAPQPSTMGSFAPTLSSHGYGAIHQQSDRQSIANQFHHLMQQQQKPFQQQEDAGDQCKCNELDDPLAVAATTTTTADECRFRCSSLPPSTPGVGQQQSLATATTFAAPSTTLSPSAKMNPLDVTFLLYTRSNRDRAPSGAGDTIGGGPANETSLLNADSMSANSIRLNTSLPIKIVIHGFGSGGRRPWVTDMVYKLLDYEDVNVIVVDWEKGATLPNYVQAAGNTRLVGHKIAHLIKSINAKFGLTGNSYHLIGFSLGAHVAGFAGMEIRNSTSVPRHWINRITGLDPASPLFEGYEANDRLDPSDAQFVDVIHSNGDGVLRGGFGSLQPMGHVDFYPNGGRVQVGCNSVLLSALSDIIYGKWQSLCNHRRALNFFMDSFEFNKCRFRSFNCDSYENYLKGECFDCGHNNEKCSYMGYLANYSKGRGKMYLTTHEEAPFCANQFIIKILGSRGYKTHWGKVEVTLVTLDGKNESFWLSSANQQLIGHNELGGGGGKESGQQQHSMQSLIVAHPVLVNFTQVLLRYTKYKGWIYSGDESWSIDKVFITDSDGQVKSYCSSNTILESHVTTRLNLEPGNCTVATESPSAATNAAGLQMSRGGGLGERASGSVLAKGNSGNSVSSITLQQSHQQQAQQQPPPQGQPVQQQQQQQQTPAPSQVPRTPRLFAALLEQSQQQQTDEGVAQTTPIANLPNSLGGHNFQQRPTAAATERPPQFVPMDFTNIPFVTTF